MKNILFVTPLYPIPSKENNTTYVCHFFTKEWIKDGYNVIVIHVQPVHCFAWHLLVRFLGKQLKNWAGGGNFYSEKLRTIEHYDMDGVPIYRIPVYNFIPRGNTPEKSIQQLCDHINDILGKNAFKPDIIVGHMLELNIIPEINKFYNCPTCMVSHGDFSKYDVRFHNYKELISSYDLWGFRSEALKEKFETKYGKVKNSFMCYSGIPKDYIIDNISRKYVHVSKFVFIGELIERKKPVAILESLHRVFGETGFHLTYIGDGPEKKNILAKAKELGVLHNMTLTGKIPRNEIKQYLDDADCFIMISKGEVFGLVYLEAMARGCLTIASKKEGIDGVIKNGENGFLCQAGSVDELSSVIKNILIMTPEERLIIALKGYETAVKMTDENVARDYLQSLNLIITT